MKITFLGKGSAFCPSLKSTSCCFVLGKKLFVLDCGEFVFEALYSKGLLDAVEEVYVILTHLHADHVGSLGSLISYSYCIQKRVINIIHPKHTAVELLRLLGIQDCFYHYYSQLPPLEGLQLSVTPTPVNHVDNMDCFGYTVRHNNESFYYSGDSSDLPAQILQQFLNGEIDTLYHDTATVKSPGHCHYERLAALIPQDRRKSVFCMHLDSLSQRELCDCGFSIVDV